MLYAGEDSQRAALLARRNRVLDRILNERLQDQAGHQRIRRTLVDVFLDDQAITEADLFDFEIQVQRMQLGPERDALHRIAVERVSQKIAQPAHSLVRGLVGAVEDERRDGVERVEQEMRVQLVTQHLELSLVRGCHGLQGLLGLLLQLLVILDSEIESAPAQHDVERTEHTTHVVHEVLRLPAVLDPVVIENIAQPLPEERNDIAGNQRRGSKHDDRPRPQRSIQRAQRQRPDETTHGRRENHGKVCLGFFVCERTQPGGQRIAGPARHVQHPEQSVPVAEYIVEIHRSIIDCCACRAAPLIVLRARFVAALSGTFRARYYLMSGSPGTCTCPDLS